MNRTFKGKQYLTDAEWVALRELLGDILQARAHRLTLDMPCRIMYDFVSALDDALDQVAGPEE